MKRWVMYHASCYDGFGSAFAAWKKFGNDNTKYTPISYNGNYPEGEKCDELYILDFSFDIGQLYHYYNCGAKKIILLDHHKTAEAKLTPYIGKESWLHIEFDLKRSGALMSWDYFHGKDPFWEDDSRHRSLIRHISDRDLWQFKMSGTKEVHQALVSYPMDFELWDTFDALSLMKEGGALLRMNDQMVNNICDKAYIKEIDGRNVPVVNTSIAWSEVGNKLLELYPTHPFAASFTVFENNIMWSLRSRSDFDVSAVAQKYGGGGHAQAAGFKTQRF